MLKFLLALLMALPATEAFAAGAGALGGSWTQTGAAGTATMNTNGVGLGTQSATDASNDRFARWTADTFGNDQYAQMTVKGVVSGISYCEVIVRAAGTGGTFACYTLYTDGVNGATHTELAVWNGGAPTVLCNFSPAAAFAANDVMKIQVVGTTLTCYKNGVVLTPSTGGTSVTNSVLSGSSSSAGLGAFWASGATPPTFDDWQGDNVATGVVLGYLGTRSLPNVGPRDQRGFLKAFPWASPIAAVASTASSFRRTLNPFGTSKGKRTKGN